MDELDFCQNPQKPIFGAISFYFLAFPGSTGFFFQVDLFQVCFFMVIYFHTKIRENRLLNSEILCLVWKNGWTEPNS